MKKKKLYLVKREVFASNIKEAMTAKGKIYEIQECEKPMEKESKVGFAISSKK